MYRIGFVANRNCVRVLKQTRVLRNLGCKVHSITNSTESIKNFDTMAYYESPKELYDLVNIYDSIVDIWTVHNEPTWEMMILKEITKKPIILDMHDSMYWRIDGDKVKEKMKDTVHWFDEDVGVEFADAVIVPSDTCKEELGKRYTKKDIVVLPSAAPMSEYQYSKNDFYGGLVYEGGITIDPGPVDAYRDHSKFFEIILKERNVFAYSSSFNKESIKDHYEGMGVVIGMLPYCDLIKRMGSHTWNFVGNMNKVRTWKHALPNKLFDAIAAGVPSVVFNCPEAEKIVREHDIGIVCKTPEEFLKRWDEHPKKRANLIKHRRKYSMESYIHRLVELYKRLI